MRFFAHDGKTTHGPAPVAEIAALPGFDGDMLVCPVGSEDSADWKPALAYAVFRRILLTPPAPKTPPVPAPAPAPAPAPTPVPAPKPAPAKECPGCGAANPERARYCNDCGGRMDGAVEKPIESPLTPAFAPEPERPPMARPGAAGGMGRMGRIADAEIPSPAPMLEPVPLPDVAPAPAAAAADAASLRKTLIAAFLGASLASGGLGYYLLRPRHAATPKDGEITLTPPPAETAAAAAAPAQTPAPLAPAPAPAPAVLPPAPMPAASPKPVAPRETRPARRPAKHRVHAPKPKPEPKPAPEGSTGGEALIMSRVDDITAGLGPQAAGTSGTPALEPPSEGAKAAASPARVAAEGGDAPVEPGEEPSAGKAPEPVVGQARPAAPAGGEPGLMLPGLPRRVGPKSVTKPAARAAAAAAEAAAAEGALAAPAGDAAPAAEDPTKRQVREQFDFCAQLLAQSAFDDHFDTCLCAEARSGPPYRGRRGLYASTLQKSAKAGRLQTEATVKDITLDGATAKVTAVWKASPGDRGATVVERWRLEDGLWCKAP